MLYFKINFLRFEGNVFFNNTSMYMTVVIRATFDIKNRITNDFYSISKYLLLKTNMSNYVPTKHKQMSFVSNGGKFKLYCSKWFTFFNAYSAQVAI
jgi:hypothetical protein